MDYELSLTKTNRIRLARAFQKVKRVDYSIDCVIEGQMGQAFVDCPDDPQAYRISIGPFWYFAGDARSTGGARMMKSLPPYCFLMPSAPGWLEAARDCFGDGLKPFDRYSFSSAGLSEVHLLSILKASGRQDGVLLLDAALANRLLSQPESYFELLDYESVEDFLKRGLGYVYVENDQILGAAYSQLVCSDGIEVSIYVEELARRRGIATALASRLLLECLQLNANPHWDAANPESCKLAQKLGYVFTESYVAYYHP